MSDNKDSGIKTAPFTSLMESALGNVESFELVNAKKGTVFSAGNGNGMVRVRANTMRIDNLDDKGVSVDFKSFNGACKGRSISGMVATPDSGEIVIKSGSSYKASIATVGMDGTPHPFDLLQDVKTDVTFNEDHKQILASALKSTKVEKTYSGIVDTLVYVEATDKSIMIASFEPAQVSYIRVKNKTDFPQCSFVLPTGTISKIMVIPGSVRVLINEVTTMMLSKICDLQIPLPVDSVNAISSEQVLGLIKSIKNTDTVDFSVSRESLMNFLDNAESVIANSADVQISSGSGNVVLSVTTGKGNIKERFKGKVSRPFNISFPFLRAALTRTDMKPDTQVEISVTDAFAVLRNATDNSTYIASLSE